MKFLVVLAVILATASAAQLKSRSVVLPTIEEDSRITKGNTAKKGQFPYQVGLSLYLTYTTSSWCGGSLIGNQWVLTAAHCTDEFPSVIVYLGSNERQAGQFSHTVYYRDFIIHDEWNRNTMKNDIALIKIPSVAYTALIQPVALPAMASSYATYDGEIGIASGWGRVSDTSSDLAKNLQYAEMPIISNAECAKEWSKITASNICVSTNGGISTCYGDSGGPLVLASTGVLVGLTSFGSASGCGWFYPAAFTRVTSYLGWIEAHTGISY